MKTRFRLTYQVVTEQSAEYGDFARHGFVTRNLTIQPKVHAYLPDNPATFGLRDAIDFLLSRESAGPVEADCCPVSLECAPRWFNYGGVLDEYGESITIGLHIPEHVTASSRVRIARLLHCYGLRKQTPQTPSNARLGVSEETI